MGISAHFDMSALFFVAAALLGSLAAVGCDDAAPRSGTPASGPASAVVGPRVRVLGTAQDGGFPHAACDCRRCAAAAADPRLARHVASLAVILPGSQQVFLIDATPDIRGQLALLSDVRPHAGQGRVDRRPLTGVFLTHAHLGHYTGLGFLGFEAIHAAEIELYATARMGEFLATNEPWATLLRGDGVRRQTLEPDRFVELGEGVSIQAFLVPHRDELSDTVGFVVRGPRNTLLYVPDTDNWQDWDPELPTRLRNNGVTAAWIDGTFFSDDELPARAVASIGHPRIVESLSYLEAFVAGGGRVAFTHFNHSNPVLENDSAARSRVREAGFEILEDGVELAL